MDLDCVDFDLSKEIGFIPFDKGVHEPSDLPYHSLKISELSPMLSAVLSKTHALACDTLSELSKRDSEHLSVDLTTYKTEFILKKKFSHAFDLALRTAKLALSEINGNKDKEIPNDQKGLENLTNYRIRLMENIEEESKLYELATSVSKLQERLGFPSKTCHDISNEQAVDGLYFINLLKDHLSKEAQPRIAKKIEQVVLKIFKIPLESSLSLLSKKETAAINTSYCIRSPKDQSSRAILKPHIGMYLKEKVHAELMDASKTSVAASLLDLWNGGICHAPLTMLTDGYDHTPTPEQLSPEYKGHIQAYVENIGSLHELNTKERAHIPVSEVHRQMTLRGRIFDTDSHTNNTLFTLTSTGLIKLIPIDMDEALPDLGIKSKCYISPRIRNEMDKFPQAHEHYSEEEINWIKSWDINLDADRLRKIDLPEGSIQIMKAASWTFQLLCDTHTPYEINKFMKQKSYFQNIREIFQEVYTSNTYPEKERAPLFQEKVHTFISLPLNRSLPIKRSLSAKKIILSL